jgi:hypothetical protein
METAYKLATSSLKGRLIAPYQREGVLWMLMRELGNSSVKGGFLCDEMGLGKTVQLIATILGNPGKKTLVVVPKSIVNQWKEELAKFAPKIIVSLFDGPGRGLTKEEFGATDVVIAPYSVMVAKGKPKGTPTDLHKFQWGRIILDEGHEIRNSSSKIHASLKTVVSQIRWVISGTPVYNSMSDFVALCEFVGIPKTVVQGLTDKVRKTYVLRRTKQDVSEFNERLELPPCDFQNVELEMYPEELEVYKDVYETVPGHHPGDFQEGKLGHARHAHPRVLPQDQAGDDLAPAVHRRHGEEGGRAARSVDRQVEEDGDALPARAEPPGRKESHILSVYGGDELHRRDFECLRTHCFQD